METKYSVAIKNLLQEHYKRNISMGEYRAQRKKILDQMDEEFNGLKSMGTYQPQPGDNSQ